MAKTKCGIFVEGLQTFMESLVPIVSVVSEKMTKCEMLTMMMMNIE
jgi:hypothetical protein